MHLSRYQFKKFWFSTYLTVFWIDFLSIAYNLHHYMRLFDTMILFFKLPESRHDWIESLKHTIFLLMIIIYTKNRNKTNVRLGSPFAIKTPNAIMCTCLGTSSASSLLRYLSVQSTLFGQSTVVFCFLFEE